MKVGGVEIETTADLGRRLEEFLASKLPRAAGLRVSVLGRTATGFSRENWPFDVEWLENEVPVRRRLLLRRDPPGGMSVIETARENEFRVLRALEATDIPAPRVHWFDAGNEWLGRPFLIMDRYEGTVDGKALTEESSLGLGLERRVRLARRYGELLASIHRLDWRALELGSLGVSPGNPAEAELERTVRFVEQSALEPQPELVEVMCWLEDRVPKAEKQVLVHGDFRPENSILDGGDIVVLLDWELARISDPMVDLAWYTMPLSASLHFIPGHWEEKDFLRHYAERMGVTIDLQRLRFWQVLTMLYVTGIATTAAKSFVERRSPFAAMTAGTIRKFTGILWQMCGF